MPTKTLPIAGEPLEKMDAHDSRIVPLGGKIAFQDLDFSSAPSEQDLRRAGQLGGALSPSRDADPGKIKDQFAKKQQEEDNICFGKAIQLWNEHNYPAAAEAFRQHRVQFPDSPWAGESELHLGCYASYCGVWDEAEFRFESILATHTKGTNIYQKAKQREAMLRLDRGKIGDARKSFREMLESEGDWRRKTYAQSWLQRLSVRSTYQASLRDCGLECIRYILKTQQNDAVATQLEGKPAPTERGYSVRSLVADAVAVGLPARALRVTVDQLRTAAQPIIIHYRDEHFVVVTGKAGNGFTVFDPRLHKVTILSSDQLQGMWSGLAIAFEAISGSQEVPDIETESAFGGCCGKGRYTDDLGGNKCGCGLPEWGVNPVNMNLWVVDTPFWSRAPVGPEFNVRLNYNSQDGDNVYELFGRKWASNLSTYVMEAPFTYTYDAERQFYLITRGSALVVTASGRAENYSPNPSTFYTTTNPLTSAVPPFNSGAAGYDSEAGVHSTLKKVGKYSYDLTLDGGTIYHYSVPSSYQTRTDYKGRTSLLTSIEGAHGQRLTFVYSSAEVMDYAEDSVGNRFWFSYDAGGHITQIAQRAGNIRTGAIMRSCTFTYQGGTLVAQTDMGGLHYGYTYDSSVYLTSITKPTGTTTFYIEPSDSLAAGMYPAPGAGMWDNYRITVTDPLGYAEEYYYDGLNGGVTWYRDKRQYRDPRGAVHGPKTLLYSSVVSSSGGKGAVSAVQYEDGYRVDYSNFNSARLPGEAVDSGTNTVSYTYNGEGQIATFTDARRNTSVYSYETTGVLKDRAVTKIVDAESRKILERDYAANGDLLWEEDGEGRRTSFGYNTYGQMTSGTFGAGTADAAVYTYEHNPAKQLEWVKKGSVVLRHYEYDQFGRVFAETDQDGLRVEFQYDGLDRVTRKTYPDLSFEEWQYGCCVLERYTDREGRSTYWLYDPLNRPTYELRPGNHVVRYQYDCNGNLRKLVDESQSVTQWEYDSRNRVTKKIYADNSSQTYNRNYRGDVWETINARGQHIGFGYDPNRNLASVTMGPSVVLFTYDVRNRRRTMTDGGGTTVWTYNYANQVTDIDGPWQADSVHFDFDSLGREWKRTMNGDSSTTLETKYDEFGRVWYVDNPLGRFTYGYAAPGSAKLTSVSTPVQGISTGFGYYEPAGDNRLRTITHSTSAGEALRFEYHYSATGRIDKWTRSIGGVEADWNLGYDSIDQLETVDEISGGIVTKSYRYGYDPAGNRTLSGSGSVLTTGSANNLNQIKTISSGGTIPVRGTTTEPVVSVTVNGGTASIQSGTRFEGKAYVQTGTNTLTVTAADLNSPANIRTKNYSVVVTGTALRELSYDLDGNLLSDGERTFEWDALDRLTAVVKGTHRSEFTYDGLWRRTKVVEKENDTVVAEKNYLWINQEIAEERAADNSLLKRYYTEGFTNIGPGGGVTGVFHYLKDHLGSIRELRDNSGALIARYDFDPYGVRRKITGSGDADFGYTGHFAHSPTGLSLTLYRAYDPELGRWLSRDPIGEAGGFNLYSYVEGSPIMDVDPDGLIGLDEFADFFAGYADSATFGLSSMARESLLSSFGIDDAGDGANHCSGAYAGGQATQLAQDLATLGASAGLKAAARNVSTQAARNAGRKFLPKVAGKTPHHRYPLAGHPGGSPTLFPTKGLPPSVHSGRGNISLVDRGASPGKLSPGHQLRHSSFQAAESALGVNSALGPARAVNDLNGRSCQ